MAQAPANPKIREKFRGRIDKYGRIVIPSEIREQLGIKPDERVTIWVEDGEIRIINIREAIRQAQEMFRKVIGDRTGLLDEFIANRRRDTGE